MCLVDIGNERYESKYSLMLVWICFEYSLNLRLLVYILSAW